jgi:hypothetical protein
MDDWGRPDSDDEDRFPAPQNDPYPNWGFNETDPDIATAPGELDSNGESFPYDRFGRVDAGGTVSVDAFTPNVLGHWLAIADSNENSVRTQEIFGGNGTAEFDLSGGGDGDSLDPGAYVIVNANGETDPRALQPLCVQAYSATVTQVTADPVPDVTVSVDSLLADPPQIGTVGVLLWNDTTETFVELSATGDGSYEGDLSGVDPGTYSLHALVADDTAEERLVGLSGTDSAEVVAQTGLTFEVDGQTDAVTIDDGETVPYTATAEYEDGTTEDVTDAVSVSVAAGDSAVVDIDETAAEITGTEAGTVTLEADDGGYTDTVDMTVEPPSQVGLTFEIDGQSDAVTIDDGETVSYTATAEFEDGTTEDVTDTVSVSVAAGDPAVVDIDETAAQVSGAEPGTATLEADDGEFADMVDVTVDAVLAGMTAEIDGQGSTVTIDAGETVPYTVTATFSDGTEETVTDEASVTSADPSVVSVDEGATEVTGEGQGETTVTAEYETEADTVDVTVGPPSQVGLTFEVDGASDAVTIDDGEMVPYTAIAEFEDGTTEDVTDAVSVSVAAGDSAVVDIDETATEITGTEAGTVTLEADDGEFADTVDVTVDAVLAGVTAEIDGQGSTVTIDAGETVPYTVTATFSDGTEETVTDEATVTSADPDVVSVDGSAAEVTGEGQGETTVTAEYETETDTVDVTVQSDEGTDVTLPDETIPPAGEATLDIVGSGIETLTVEDLWTDWTVSVNDADGGETTNEVGENGWVELAWDSERATVSPAIAVTPPDRYVAGEYELTVIGTGSNGSTATDTAIVTIDDGSV